MVFATSILVCAVVGRFHNAKMIMRGRRRGQNANKSHKISHVALWPTLLSVLEVLMREFDSVFLRVLDIVQYYSHPSFCRSHICPITNAISPTTSSELRTLLESWSIAWLRSPSLCPSSFHLTYNRITAKRPAMTAARRKVRTNKLRVRSLLARK